MRDKEPEDIWNIIEDSWRHLRHQEPKSGIFPHLRFSHVPQDQSELGSHWVNQSQQQAGGAGKDWSWVGAGKDWSQVGAGKELVSGGSCQAWILQCSCPTVEYRAMQSTVHKPLCVFCLYVGKRVLANTVKKCFLRRSGILNKGQRFALKALEVRLNSPYSRLVDIPHKAEISVSRKNPIFECADKVDDKTCA